MASDEDLKLSDTLRYYMRDSAAAKDLLYRRIRALADYETANKNLEKARTKNKDVPTVSRPYCFECHTNYSKYCNVFSSVGKLLREATVHKCFTHKHGGKIGLIYFNKLLHFCIE